MADDESTAPPALEDFKRAYLAANEAFNRHDFQAAFGGLDPELEWHTVAHAPGGRCCTDRGE